MCSDCATQIAADGRPMGPVRPEFVVDSSVAIAAIDGAHAAHIVAHSVCVTRRPAIAGHAAFEVLSVLTRMPGALRIAPTTAVDVIHRHFPNRLFLSVDEQSSLLDRLGPIGIAGGAVYDALVAESARLCDATLLTRDRRAMATYQALGARFELVE
jgi:predicted nucleic acid-binding protein